MAITLSPQKLLAAELRAERVAAPTVPEHFRPELPPKEAGEWKLGWRVGMGGTADVYKATGPDGQVAAVKSSHDSLPPGLVTDAQWLGEVRADAARAAALPPDLEREAGILRQLADSHHVVDVFQSGVGADHRPFLAMELLEGKSLAQQLRTRPRMPLQDVVKLVDDVSAGLEAARKEGIVHLDVKPENIVWNSNQGVWKLVDFANAKVGADEVHRPRPGAVSGTPGYMAPEMVALQPVDHRADVFALGAVAYEAGTGRRAFVGGEKRVQIESNLGKQPPRPSGRGPELTEEIDRVLGLALARDPEQRFATAGELRDALHAAVEGKLPEDVKARADEALEILPWT